MKEDILNFKVKLYSSNNKYSPIEIYLAKLVKNNPIIAQKVINSIKHLPDKIFFNIDIKTIKYKNIKFQELKIKSSSNICRLFFTIEKPNIIVIHGFTKKSQKIDKRDLNQGFKNYQDYCINKRCIDFYL